MTTRPLYRIAALRTIEQTALALLPAGTLMQRAGKATAEIALALLGTRIADASVLILAGPGNNGGDALEAATHLAAAGAQVDVLLLLAPAGQPADAVQALARARTTSITFVDRLQPRAYSLVLDGLFGIGLTRSIDGALRLLVEQVNQLDCPILALDVPSGLDADSGMVIGADGVAIRATHTITFIGDKPGLHTGAGRDYAGQVALASLDLDLTQRAPSPIQLNGPGLFGSAVHRRVHDSHKGSFGDVAVLGGADGMTGAVLLAARAALHCGAGRVYAAFVGAPLSHDALYPELMCRQVSQIELGKAVLVVGPGLGATRASKECLMRVFQSSATLVLDADALNLIAAEPGLIKNVARHRAPLLMTPHPLEAARLLNRSAAAVQADRLNAATELAQQCDAVVVLKGSGTVIAHPEGALVINSTGNPALATGGTGDVLAGVCGALLAQGWPVWEAALGAVWLHGRAADRLVQHGVGPIGMFASELLPHIRHELNQLKPVVPPRL